MAYFEDCSFSAPSSRVPAVATLFRVNKFALLIRCMCGGMHSILACLVRAVVLLSPSTPLPRSGGKPKERQGEKDGART